MQDDTIRNNLRGCCEILVFLRQGVERFANTKQAFLRSLLVVLLLIPLQIPIAQIDPELSQYHTAGLVVALAYRVIVSTAFFLGGVWLLTWPLERKDRFYRFATAVNWLGIAGYGLLLTYYIPVSIGLATAEQAGNYLLFIVGYAIAMTAFTARHALNVHWAVAVPIGIGVLVCEIVAAMMIGGLQPTGG